MIHADLGDHPRAAIKRCHMLDTSGDDLLAFAFLTALRAGIIFGLNRVSLNIIGLVADRFCESHKGSS